MAYHPGRHCLNYRTGAHLDGNERRKPSSDQWVNPPFHLSTRVLSNHLIRFMAMAGVGVGLGIGPLAVHARFSQPEDRVAVVSALTLFVRPRVLRESSPFTHFFSQFRSLGGTVGLAQCGAVLNGKVNSYLTNLINSGGLNGVDPSTVSAASSGSLSSLQSISALPPEAQDAVREAFKIGSRWCFISLVPWSGVAVIATLFLSNIKDRAGQTHDKPAPEEKNDVVQLDDADKGAQKV